MISPYAAPTDSRFSPIEISGSRMDRNAISITQNASRQTTASTIGVRACTVALQS